MAEITKVETAVKMVKVEEGPNKGMQVPMPKSMGHINLRSPDAPAIKDWEVGQDYEVTITIRQTSKRKPDRWEIESGKMLPEDVSAEFDIIGIEIPAAQPAAKADPASTPAINYGN